MLEGKRFSAMERRYARLNVLWPRPLPALTEQEAISAAKRLYRLGMGAAFTGAFKITTGNRRTWIRQKVFHVNASKGWDDLVHAISHLTHYRKHPHQSGHHPTHAEYEHKLIEAVVTNGWLDGRLRRATPTKPDVRAVRYQRVLLRITNWERKKKRAETALQKLYKSKTYYEKE